ncbi:MAG: hypothetical protein LBT12_05160 [Oscillospiraceae bacterium]|jgi:hypothetical protein|nr:hypothetical protein [Oscillospiraceae bacterium]
MDHNELHTKLLAPFADADIEWRLQWTDNENGTGIAVPYVTNRAIQNRLDNTVGVDGWKNEYVPWHSDGKKASQLCGISIWSQARKDWITKYDGADDSDIEPIKGGLSDSMKRTAVQWGIGRYLYGMDAVFVSTEKRGKTTIIKKSETAKLNQAHREHVKRFFGAEATEKTDQPPTAPPETEKQTPPKQPPKQQDAPHLVPNITAEGPPEVYMVLKVVPVASVKRGQDSNLQLRDINGKTVEVFLRGFNPSLTSGTILRNCVFSEKANEGVRYCILEKYEIAAQDDAA